MTHGKICLNKTVGVLGVSLFVIIGLVYFSFITSNIQTSTNSRASINCRNYNTKQCPTSQGCQISGSRCIPDPNFQLVVSTNTVCTEDVIIQVMYYGSNNSYTAARVATGKKESSQRTLTGGLNPINITSDCTVKFVTCPGSKIPGVKCNGTYVGITIIKAKYPTMTCQDVCTKLYKQSWCDVKYGFAQKYYGCKDNRQSDGYNPGKYGFYGIGGEGTNHEVTIDSKDYYMNGDNLYSCNSDPKLQVRNSSLYNTDIKMCCQTGCVDPIEDMTTCNDEMVVFDTKEKCTAFEKPCDRCKKGNASYFYHLIN